MTYYGGSQVIDATSNVAAASWHLQKYSYKVGSQFYPARARHSGDKAVALQNAISTLDQRTVRLHCLARRRMVLLNFEVKISLELLKLRIQSPKRPQLSASAAPIEPPSNSMPLRPARSVCPSSNNRTTCISPVTVHLQPKAKNLNNRRCPFRLRTTQCDLRL